MKPISAAASERIIRFAFEYARAHGRREVAGVTKANIMKFTDGLFLSVFREVAADYPDIEPREVLVDALTMQLVQRPEEFDVLVLPNLYGDIISDLTAGLVGGLGVAPGANIGEHAAVFEATHGSAPKYKGQNKVNPTAMILSGKLMLDHLGERDAAARLESAVAAVIAAGERVTYDLKPTRDDPSAVGTSEYADAIIESSTAWQLTKGPHAKEDHRRRRRERRRDLRAGARAPRLRGRRPRRHHPELPAGEGARHQPGGRGPRLRADDDGLERLRGDRGLRRRRDHGRQAALAGDEPRRPRRDERGDRLRGDEGGGQALARRDPRRRLEPARRDVPRREGDVALQEASRRRHGGHPRHRALLDVHRAGARRLGEGRHCGRPRRPRRPDGSGRLGDERRRRPAPELLPKARIRKLVERTKVGGGELVGLLGTSAWYAPGAAAAQMVDSICLDEKRVLPCTAYLEGEYGINGLYMGVPVKLGAAGVEEIVKLRLTADEKKMLRASAAAVREVVGVLKRK